MDDKLYELIKELKSDDLETQLKACWLLGKRKAKEAVPQLIQILEMTSNPELKERVIKALGEIGDISALSPLIEALKDKRWEIKNAVIEALGRIRDKRAIPILEKLLLDNEVRVYAAQALAQLGVSQPLEGLLKEKEPWIVAKAAEAIGKLGIKDAINSLIDVLNHPSWEVQIEVIEALGKLRASQAVKEIIYLLNKSSKPEVQAAGVLCLSKIAKEEAIPSLIKALKSHHQEVRSASAEALGNLGLGGEKVVDALVEVLLDPYWVTRANAARALGVLKNKKAIKKLLNLIKDHNPNVRVNVITALAEIGGTKVIKDLQEALEREESSWVKTYLEEIIANLKREEASVRRKILVIEDDKFLLKFICTLLESYGFEVATASNGEEALGILEQLKPELIILDIMMPVMDGWELVEKIKLNQSITTIPIIVVSAKSEEKNIQRAQKLGVAGYFPKPFDPKELIKTIEDIFAML